MAKLEAKRCRGWLPLVDAHLMSMASWSALVELEAKKHGATGAELGVGRKSGAHSAKDLAGDRH